MRTARDMHMHTGHMLMMRVCMCAVQVLPGAEAYDTAMIVMRFANGKEATIDVCRQAPYGYDQR